MNNIIEPNDSFDFSKLSLAHPNGIQGGAYFTKILYNSSPLYIQTTKSLTRQGFIKSGKKYYCDLMFDNNSETLIRWFENLEETCQSLIFDKSESWFQNSLDKSDVESAFNSVIRIYKSGKYYLLRTNVKITTNNEPAIKIYNENEIPLSINDINSETNLISILEIQGIKFTSRNFQIEIELKQTMVLDNEPLFNNCLIKTIKRNTETNNIEANNSKIYKSNDNDGIIDIVLDNNLENKNHEHTCNNINLGNTQNIEKIENDDNDHNDDNDDNENNVDNQKSYNHNYEYHNDAHSDINHYNDHDDNKNTKNENEVDIQIEDLNLDKLDDFETNKDLLKEIDLDVNLENNLETFTLKKPNQVYYELYKEARNKAKIAKKAAIIAYLEAKNIKKTYLLDKIDNSDGESDIDDEIDEVSESELESL
jgi:hypothetical protein